MNIQQFISGARTKLTLLALFLVLTALHLPSTISNILEKQALTTTNIALAAPAGLYQHTLGNELVTGIFTDSHNPSIFVNESDTFINKSEATVAISVDKFNFYAESVGNPVTPLVVKVHADNDFTVLAIGETRSSYAIGVNNFDFADSPPVISVDAGERIATGFMDSNADGSGWGIGGNPIPAENSGANQNNANNFPLDQDEVWLLSPSPLVLASAGFDADADTPAAVVNQKILATNNGKALQEYNLLRSYSFEVVFSADTVFNGATLYTDPSFAGTSQRFSDGISDLSASNIGANAASSIKVESGYIAYLCNGSMDNPEECTLYEAGNHDSLGDLNNQAIYIKVDQNDPYRHGQWGDVTEIPQRAIASAQMPDGRVMFWQGGNPIGAGKGISIIDPKTLVIGDTGAPANHDTFCPGPALMADGSLILAGGGRGAIDPDNGEVYEDASSVFDWESTTWIRTEDMQEPHYYGTSVALANGEVFHALGSRIAANDDRQQSDNPELWTGTSWEKMTGLDLTPLHADNGYYNSNYYPYLHLMPNSNLFHSGGVPTMHEINPRDMLLHNQGTRAGNDVYRHWGNSIMIDEGVLFISGGRTEKAESMRSTVLIDINNGLDIKSEFAADMHYDRAFHDMVQLPTGDVFVSGGNSTGKIFQDYGTVYATELYDRETDSWAEMAELTTPRNYHSTSFLLPDGRIWQAGGDCAHCIKAGGSEPGFNHHYNLQFYSPPYLFKQDGSPADRPSISSYPSEKNGVVASQSFDVEVTGSGATEITTFNIIKLSSTTHQMNTDVRRLSLGFTNNGGGQYSIAAHDNINVMTPGYWMLFAVNQAGVPSEAGIIHVSMTLGTENPAPNLKPNKKILGNISVGTGGIDGFKSNLIINLSDAYTNESGSAEEWYLSKFDFYAGGVDSPVTPFIVTINGDQDFTVKAIGTSRTPQEIGAHSHPFTDNGARKITLAAGEKIAIGFIDANPDGNPSGPEAKAIIARRQHNEGDTIFYVGASIANVATLIEGQAPIFKFEPREAGKRDYAFSITLVDIDPTQEATPTPTATITPTPEGTEMPEKTETPTSTLEPGSTSTPTPTNTPVPTGTPNPPAGDNFAIFLPSVTR